MGYKRKVKEEITITCDRCGIVIASEPDYIAHMGFFKVLKWCIPNGHCYKKIYLCKHCWNGLNEYLDVVKNETGGDT